MLRKRPKKETVKACGKSPTESGTISKKILAGVKDKYKGERCAQAAVYC